ncbi:MAG TPA: M20/M25/M40 family metallo-hydrolase, partial [Longimicrobiales bacterium]|nr:M20/M25/M40 family metallo-hydrolase [Longimicrobiales bacterium]
MMQRIRMVTAVLAMVCALPAGVSAQAAARVDVAQVRAGLTALAHDSMEGRRGGTAGAHRAARWIAAQMRDIGLTPAGDSAYHQRIPLAQVTVNNRTRMVALTDMAALDTIAAERRGRDANIVGYIAGSDPALRREAIVVGAHFDHLGIGAAVDGDSIFNGADDDASGVIAVLEIARALKAGVPPKRTVVFVAFAGEEMGGYGSRWYMAHPLVPLEQTAAQFQIEMIARPDSLAGGPGKAWLTGYDLSTMGATLAEAGVPIVQDPRLSQNFFSRSDNYRFALAGIPAHTLSSFNLHSDYHRVGDEVDGVDFEHMTAVIEAGVTAVRLLADGPKPEWLPGKKP